MKIFNKNQIIITTLLIITFYTLFILYSDIESIEQHFKKIDKIFVVPILSIILTSIFLRSLVQRFLLQTIGIDISIKNSFFIFLNGLSMIITPFGSGQMIKSYFIEKKFGYSIAKTLPITFVERLHDLLGVTIIISITLSVFFSIESILTIFVSYALIVVLLFIGKKKQIPKILTKIPIIKNILKQESEVEFNSSLNSLLQNKIILKTLLMVVPITFFEGIAIYLGFLTFNVHFDYFQSIQIYFTSLLFGAFSLIPGGIGFMEGGFSALLSRQNIELDIASSLIIFIRITTIWFVTLIGMIITFLKINK